MSKKFLNHFLLFKYKKDTVFALIFSILLVYVNYSYICIYHFFEIPSLLFWVSLLASILITFGLAEIFLQLKKVFINKKLIFTSNLKIDKSKIKKYYLCVLLILVFSYFLIFLAYYPGIFAYDIDNQLHQEMGSYSTFNPLLYTLIIQAFYNFGKMVGDCNLGIALFCIFQMIIFSMVLTYIHLFLYKLKIKSWIRYIFIAFTCLMPFFSIFSISTSKDALFTVFFGLMALCTLAWETGKSIKMTKFTKFLYILSICMIVSLRNNGWIAVIVCLVVGLIIKFNEKKDFLKVSCLGIVIAVVFSGFLVFITKAVPGTINEAFSIPYQQLANVYNKEHDNLSDADKSEIKQLLPTVEKYNPYYSDPVKDYANGHKDVANLLNIWAKYLFKYPFEYIEAFLNCNAGYLNLFDISHSEIYGTDINDRFGYMQTNMMPGFDVEHTTYFPILEDINEWLYTSNNYHNIPILNAICSPALYFWIIIMFLFFSICNKKGPWILQIYNISYIITMLLGPCCVIRYACPYILCVPLIMFGFSYLNNTDLDKEK